MFNLFNWSHRGPSSNVGLKRLKRSFGAGLSLMLLLLASAGTEQAIIAAGPELSFNETGVTLEGLVVVAQGEEIPEGTEAWLISDHFSGPLDVSENEEESDGVVAKTGVNSVTGAYSFSDVEEGFYLIAIKPPTDSDFALTRPVFVEVFSDFVSGIPDIELAKAQLSGYVLETGTENGIQARVELFHTTDFMFYETRTIDGKYSFGGLETSGEYEIAVWPDESEPYAFSGFQKITIDISQPMIQNIELDPPSVTGLVVDPEQKPMRDVTVNAWQKFDDGTTGPLFGDEGGLPTYADDWTGRDGTFALGALAPGTYVIEAFGGTQNDVLPPDPIEIEIPYDGPSLTFQFKGFEAGVKVLNGSVTDADGNPITDAQVHAQHMTSAWWRSTETDDNGEYSLDLIGGEWNVFIEPIKRYDHNPTCPPEDAACEPFPGECPPEDQECEPFPGTCPPEDQECEPFPGTCPPEDQECEPFPGECPPEDQECEPFPGTCPPEDQECEPFPGTCPPEDQTCTVDFSVSEDAAEWIFTEGGRTVYFADDDSEEVITEDFEVTSANAKIVGTILTAKGDAPTYWISIGAFNSEGHGAHAEPDQNGYFELAVPAGHYEIFIHADFNSGAEPPGVINVNVAEDEEYDLGEIKMISSSSQITGQVTSNNLPVKDVKIVAWKIDGFAYREVDTNSNGEYTLNVSPGLWFVVPAYSPDSDFVFNDPGFEVDVEDDETVSNIDFSVISSKSKIKGVIVDSNGNPLGDGVFGWVHVESIDDQVDNPAGTNEDCPPNEIDCESFPGECPPEDQECEPFPGQCPPEDQECEPFPGECPPEDQECEPFPGECPPEDAACEPFPGECPPEDATCEPHPSDCDGGEDGDPNTPANQDDPHDKEEPCFGGYKPPSFMTGAPINNGSFSVQVPAGDYRVMVFVDGDGIFASQEVEVTVAENDIAEIEVAAQSANSTISGQLVDARTNDPVDLSSDDDGRWFADVFAWSDSNFTNAFIDRDTGTYSMDVISGTWHVDHWLGDHSEYVAVFNPESTVTVGDDEDVIFNLPVVRLDAELSGQVLDPTGNPISGAEVIIRGTGDFEDVWLFQQTNISGTYQINVAYGDYIVEAAFVGREESANWFMPEPVEVSVAEDSQTVADPLQFREANATLSGTITAAGATADGYAYVWAWSDTGGFKRTRIELISDGTNASGDYSMRVIDGNWFVDAVHESGNSFWFGEDEVVVSGDSSLDLTLTQTTIELPDTMVQTFVANEPFEMSMDDGTKISIPANAMPVDTITETISISIDPIASLPDQDHAEVVNYGYQILAKDSTGALIEASFNQDVELTFRYDPSQTADIPEDELQVAYYSTTTERWTYVENFIVDTDNNTITMLIDHFTDFAVVGDPSNAVTEPENPTGSTLFLPIIR